MQKENPNPVVHTTNKRSHSSRPSEPLLGASAIRRYNLGAPSPSSGSQHVTDGLGFAEDEFDYGLQENGGLSFGWSTITAEDRSVALALSAAAYPSVNPSTSTPTSSAAPADASPSSTLDILQQAGFALFHPQRIQKQCKAIRYPTYAPSLSGSRTQSTTINTTSASDMKRDAITANEVFDIIRNIQDPEHPLTLEQLNVARLELVDVVDTKGGTDAEDDDDVEMNEGRPKKRQFSIVHVQFTPTIPHCSMATLIGLSLRVKLLRSLPPRFKVVVKIEAGTHVSEHAVNKQLADKERVRAALENEHLLGVVNRCIAGGMQMQ